MSRGVGRLRLAAWLLLVATITVALHHAGTGQLATPALTSPEGWHEWLAARDPLVAAVALVRMLALAAAWYLLVASVAGVVLRVCRARRLVALADRLTVPALRQLLVATAGVTLMSGVSPALALARPSPLPAAVAASAQPTTTVADAATTSPPTLTMRLLEPGETAPALRPPPPSPSPSPPVRASPAGAVGQTWTVQPGQCFWTIAEDVLGTVWGRPVTDAEIVPYWRVLIEENRSRLADRANEDLIFPGQVFSVPAPPVPSAR